MDANHTTPDLSIDSNKRDPLSSSQPYVYGVSDRPFRRNGLRPQQAPAVENHAAEQAPPAKMEPAPSVQRKPTKKSSLFGLFSRANSEKQQPNALRDQNTPPPTPPIPANFSVPKPEAPPSLRPTSAARDASQRAPSVLSNNSHATHSTFEPAPPIPGVSAHRSVASWDPPPLFQAYAQSTKHGLLEFPNASFSSSNSAKGRKTGAAQSIAADNRSRDSAEDTRSIETKKTAKTVLSRHNNSAAEEVPRKIFVLISSGYLLQYSDTGPSERLPERFLQLGMESAAFASDVIPGRHHVIQVFQAVDAKGESVASSGSFFSRLGKRNAVSKQMTSSYLLLMPDGREMDSWILAFRENIESLGGKKARPDTADTTTVRPSTGESSTAEQESKEPSTGNYPFQIRNEPLKSVSPIAQSPVEPVSPQLSSQVSVTTYDDEKAETNTIDDIDDLAADLDERLSPKKARGESDFFSFTSTVATTVDLNPKSTLRNSQRRSDASAATLATTVGTPAATSLNGSPLFEDMVNGAFQTPSENKSPTGPNSESRRQSAAQLRSSRGQNLPKLDILAQAQEEATDEEVAVNKGSGLKPYLLPPIRAPMATASSPDLRALAEARSRHDSKMPMPPLPVREDTDELGSILAGMAPLNSWLSNSSMDTSSFPTPVADNYIHPSSYRLSLQQSPYAQEAQRQKRRSKAFNMPMKINPSLPLIDPPERMVNRDSRLFEEDEFQSPVPVVHTLTAKGGEDGSRPSSAQRSSLTSPKAEVPNRSVTRNTTTRPFMLSTAIPPPLPSPLLSLSPMLVGSNEASPQPSPAISQGKVPGMPLKRPPSIRVSSNHAPFLQSVRTSGSGLPGQTGDSPANTPSLRTLRSSQSHSHLPSASPSLSSTGSFGMPSPSLEKSSTPRDGGLRLTPSIRSNQSPFQPSSGGSTPRLQRRKSRSPRNALPELDFGIPVVGLGPPAPPPSAPLPLPPQMNGSRTTSPLPSPMASPNLANSPSGLGIRI